MFPEKVRFFLHPPDRAGSVWINRNNNDLQVYNLQIIIIPLNTSEKTLQGGTLFLVRKRGQKER
jgi:hypothetical protein